LVNSTLKRVTVVLEIDTISDLRILQADVIKKTSRNVSFSQMVNNIATFGMKKITLSKMIRELDLK